MEMRVPVTVLRVVTVGPALLVSFVLATVLVALAPPVMVLPLFLAGALLLFALAVGGLEVAAVQLFTGSRLASEGERQVMAAMESGLCALGIESRGVQVRRRQRSSTPAVLVIGRRSLVVTPGLVEALYRGWLSTDELVALVGHAVCAHDARGPRCEIAVMAATTPWRAVMAVVRWVAAAFAWLPLVRGGWALRGVIGVICVVQSIGEGRAAAGLFGGAVIGLTYVVPAAGRALHARTESAGDRLVAERGLGGVLLGLLDRYGYPVPLERRQLLQMAGVPASPTRLHLVPN